MSINRFALISGSESDKAKASGREKGVFGRKDQSEEAGASQREDRQ